MLKEDMKFDPNVFIWDFETVTNWSQRIAHYSPEQKKAYHYMIPKFDLI